MSKEKINVNVLVTARNEYTTQLKENLAPLLLEGFVSIYNDAVELQEKEGTYQFIKQFQLFLKDIPKWNQTILVDETNRILEKIPYLQKLLTAIFVSHVKILSSIKLGGSHKNIQIKIPPSDILIHKLYISCAQEIYKNENILLLFKNYDYDTRTAINTVSLLIEDVIDKTLKSFIPIQSILEEYLNNVFTNDVMRTEPDSDSEESIESPVDTEGLSEPLESSNQLDSLDSLNPSDEFSDISPNDTSAPIMKITENSAELIDPPTSFESTDPISDSFESPTDLLESPTDPIESNNPISNSFGSSEPSEFTTEPTDLTTPVIPISDPTTDSASDKKVSFFDDLPVETPGEFKPIDFGDGADDLFKVGNTGLSPVASTSETSFF